MSKNNNEMMWANLLHLGYNMWLEEDAPQFAGAAEYLHASPTLLCNRDTWNDITTKMAEDGLNTLIIDLGEGLRYESYPELAVNGSWTPEELRRELARLRGMGITPIPKLNFSASHDTWLGEYSRCLSTKLYYEVCRNLINEVIELFETPPYFHLGMDEENYIDQRNNTVAVIRHGDQWWKDVYYLIDTVERRNVRCWLWADHLWNNKEAFLRKMPKSVLLSNWYYRLSFDSKAEDEYTRKRVEAYLTLEEHGFEQVPTGSNWACEENFDRTVRFCQEHIAPERLKGFMQTSWAPTVAQRKYFHLDAVDLVAQAKRKYYHLDAVDLAAQAKR